MKKVAILISHIPNPRILKRVKSIEYNFDISLIYWDRMQKEKESFEVDSKHNLIRIVLKAPQGKTVKRIIPLIGYIFKAISTLKDENPDIIHVANIDMLFIAMIYQRLFNKGAKMVYEVADLPKYSFVKKINSLKTLVSKVLQIIERKMTDKVSKLILTSPFFWDIYYSKFVDIDKYLFMPNAPSKVIFDKYEKKDKQCFTIGFIGSVRYVEQLKMLIDATSELNKDIKVLIAGSGPGYEDIVEYVKNKKHIEIYGPYNYEKEIVSLYEKLDCVYSVYNTNLQNVQIALPNRLYESIVCEIPIIGARGTVLGEFIENNKIGFNINYDNKKELKEELFTLINSKEQVSLYQANCKKIKENYYYESNSEKLLKEYIKL